MSVYIRWPFVNKLNILCLRRHISGYGHTNLKNIKPDTTCHQSIRNVSVCNKICIIQKNYRYKHSIYNTFTSSATDYGSKKSNIKSGKKKNKNTSAIDDLLDELSDDEDEEKKDSADTDVCHGNRSSPAALFVDGIHKGGASKGKSKGGKGSSSGSHPHHVDYQEAMAVIDIELYWEKLEEVVNNQRHFFVQHVNVRSANALDELEIDLEGDKFPLKEVASISKRDPKRVVIDSSTFPQATVSIMKMLTSSTLNLNPQQEGTRIYVAIPKVTRETREILAKSARSKMNETKIELRDIQNKYIKDVDNIEKAGKSSIPKDNFAAVKNVLMTIEQNFLQIAEADTLKKQKDLLNKS